MNALSAASLHAAHAYREWTWSASPTGTAEFQQNLAENRQIEAVRIELSENARTYLAQPRNAPPSPETISTYGLDTHETTIAPDGAGRREAPMRAAISQTPIYHPPGGALDLQI